MQATPEKRGHWGSKIGFIFAAAGSAVGLGNIWRFPYLTGENGGAAFVVVYLCCVVFIALPILYNELALGRATGANPVGAFQKSKPGTPFVLTGWLCLLLCFIVLSYYGVIAGWAIGYALKTIIGNKMGFEEFAANPMYTIPLFLLFIVFTVMIVQAGIESGIEKWSKVLMPILFIMMIVIIARSLTFEGASAGVVYYLKPDFSKINGQVVLSALGQAFFSLSVGWGLMITYGSYMPRTQSILSSGFWVAFADTAVAILGGLMVFPAVFAFGLKPDAGPALTFTTLPVVFEQMPMGVIVGTLFFLLLTIAALTSSISMLEVPVSYFVDEKKGKRKTAAWIVGVLAFVMGIPSALSSGGVDWLTHIPWGRAMQVEVVAEGAGPVTEVDVARLENVGKVMIVALNTEVRSEADEAAAARDLPVLRIDTLESMSGTVTETLRDILAEGVRDVEAVVRADTKENASAAVAALRKLHITKTKSFMDIMDAIFGTLLVIIIALLCSVYTGWVWGLKNAVGEIQKCSPHFTRKIAGGVPLSMIWGIFIQFVCPIVIFIVLIKTLKDFFN